MPSFQSPVPISGKSVIAEAQAVEDGAGAVFVEAGGVVGAAREIVVGVFAGAERAAFEKRHAFVEHAGVAGVRDVAAGGQDQPQEIVGADACARRGLRADATNAGRRLL